MPNQKKVFITGSAGFVGANAVRGFLNAGYAVHAAVRPGSDTWRLEEIKNDISIVPVDILDGEGLEKCFEQIKPDIVLHLVTHGGYSFQKDTERIVQTNFLGTVRLLVAAERVGFEQCIIAGSSSEYGKKFEPMKETDVLEPNIPYGVSKAASSLYAQHRGREGKLPIVVLRLFSVYGDWEESRRLFPTLILKAFAGKDLETTDPSVARDFIFVHDVVEAFVKAAETKGLQGDILNLCTGTQGTIGEVADRIVKEAGSSSRIVSGAYAERSFDTSIWVGDSAKLSRTLGWSAKTTLEEGIRKTVEWFRSHRELYQHV